MSRLRLLGTAAGAAILLALAPSRASAASTDTLKARVVVWDIGFKPAAEEAWLDRVAGEVDAAIADRVDVLVLPELIGWGLAPYKKAGDDDASFITREWSGKLLPRLAGKLRGTGMLVHLGSYPHRESGWKHVFNRAAIWHRDAWVFADKLDPTQPEALEDPPVRAGSELPILSFRGGRVAPLVCYSVEKPEVAAKLKAAGVQMLLVPSATSDEHGVGRILRAASARAVELGAAVLVAPLSGEQDGWSNEGSAALFLPDQKGFEAPQQQRLLRKIGIHREDFSIPWGDVLALRTQAPKPETRPFLAPSPDFKIAPAP